ncbi:MAG: type III secretion system chaperone [Deltaproteobacteria bacterium]|jgi:hypothetical protein|nr:type III secretion system chaperone [Deltaproteobacteria bacterium]
MENAFTGLIQALSSQLRTPIEIKDNCKVHVNFDAVALLIEHLADAEQVLLVAPVADVPSTGLEAFYRDLLQGQYVFAETSGATLAIDKDERFVSLQMAPSLRALTIENFPTLVENFVNMVERWRMRCLEASERETKQNETDYALEHTSDSTMMRI